MDFILVAGCSLVDDCCLVDDDCLVDDSFLGVDCLDSDSKSSDLDLFLEFNENWSLRADFFLGVDCLDSDSVSKSSDLDLVCEIGEDLDGESISESILEFEFGVPGFELFS